MIQPGTRIFIFLGAFLLMALSNAIIPILPDIKTTLSVQSYIFSAYFFGAMVTTLPGGIISDRIGQIPLIVAGLILTFLSGILLIALDQPELYLAVRLIEGVGAGFFVSASLSWINQRPDHISLSGVFMALLNSGLLTGLIGAGWLSGIWGYSKGGILFFTIVIIFPLVMLGFRMIMGGGDHKRSAQITEEGSAPDWNTLLFDLYAMGIRQAPLWFSVIILLGITGFVQAVYPDLSDLSPLDIGITLAVMNLATIIASLTASRIRIEPVLLIRISAVSMGMLVLVFMQYPVSVFFMGFVAGLVTIAQINYLAFAEERQGIAMGLFSTSSYAGMTFLPVLGGTIIGLSSISQATWCIALLAGVSALFIGRCSCRGFRLSAQ